MLEAFSVSAGLVALAEMGDKTQLLALLLAAKFRRPVPVLLGILAATLLNHAGAASIGVIASQWLDGQAFQMGVGAAFILMAGWALVPDKDEAVTFGAHGVFVATLIAFFLAEIGDKTQIATALLAARFQDVAAVTLGTTIGMMIANAPAVLLGERLSRALPLAPLRTGAALLFAAIGAWVIIAALSPVS